MIILIIITGSGCRPGTAYLSPGRINDTLLDSVVRVRGKITYAIINPSGLGGLYMTLNGGGGSVDVRIQRGVWDGYEEAEKALYREGRTVTVEGILVKAGAVFVVIHGKYSESANLTP